MTRNAALAHWRWASVSPDDLEARATAHQLMAAWCDDFQRAMTWLCSPEPTVTIPLKEHGRLLAGCAILAKSGLHFDGRQWRPFPSLNGIAGVAHNLQQQYAQQYWDQERLHK